MGLISRVLTLPLAPALGVVWLADKLAQEAERQRGEEPFLLTELRRLEEAAARGEMDEAERERREDDVLRRLVARPYTTRTDGGDR